MRAARRLEVAGTVYEAFAAWTSAGGLTLCYFMALGDESAGTVDRNDRRAVLEPAGDLAELSEGRLLELLAAAVPLTETERRFETPGDGSWLAQNVGPVWAEGVAAGLTGILFSDLAGSAERRQVAGGPIADLSEAELIELWTDSQEAPGV